MDPALVIDIGKQALWLVMLISGPLLMAGLIVGLLVGVFQAVTQIHEMTLTFIPKIVAIFGILFFMMPWILQTFIAYTVDLFNMIPTIIR